MNEVTSKKRAAEDLDLVQQIDLDDVLVALDVSHEVGGRYQVELLQGTPEEVLRAARGLTLRRHLA